MQTLGAAHFALAIACLFLGAAVLLQQKGRSRHRLLGYLYSGGLLLVNAAVAAAARASDPGGAGGA